MGTIAPITVDDILQSTRLGSVAQAITNNLYGLNHEQTPTAVPANRERQGYTFFTRPQLNLQTDNIRNSRKFMPLASDRDFSGGGDGNTSIHRYIRTMLDPRLMTGYSYRKNNVSSIKSALTNNELAFIPVLTNNIMSATGFPDPVVPMYTSQQGRLGESIAFVDGIVENYEQYTVDCTFRNTVSDPLPYMFWIWNLYMSYVFQGKMVPYPDFIVHNRIDYNSRIFRIRLDRNHYRVTKIFSTGPAIPIASNLGSFADLNIEDVFHSTGSQPITVRFQCLGMEFYDDILILEFNAIVQMFQANMKEQNRGQTMILIPRSISHLFQFRAYPRINPATHVMEWWVEKTLFDVRTRAFLNALQETEDIVAAQAEASGESIDPADFESEDIGDGSSDESVGVTV